MYRVFMLLGDCVGFGPQVYRPEYIILRVYIYNIYIHTHTYTVIPRLTSDTANEFFG